jgi:hypothetical protein
MDLSYGGTNASLSDPNNDRIFFWDDGAGVVTWLSPNTGISISGTSLNADMTLDEIGNPGADKTFSMGTYGLKFDWNVDDPGTEIRFEFESDALETDTDLTLWKWTVDANGTPIVTWQLLNFSSIDNIKIDSVSINDLDMGFTVQQTMTGGANIDNINNLDIGGTDIEDVAATFTNKTYVDFATIEAWRFLEKPAVDDLGAGVTADFSPFTHAYGDDDLDITALTTDETNSVYVTAGGAARVALVKQLDDDGTDSGQSAIYIFKPDLVGMGASTGLKVRWHGIVTDATTIGNTETVIIQMWGACGQNSEDLDALTVGSLVAVTYTGDGNDTQDDLIVSDWVELGTDNITSLGTDFTCQVWMNRSSSDTYASDIIGVTHIEMAFQRTMPAWATVTGSWNQ